MRILVRKVNGKLHVRWDSMLARLLQITALWFVLGSFTFEQIEKIF